MFVGSIAAIALSVWRASASVRYPAPSCATARSGTTSNTAAASKTAQTTVTANTETTRIEGRTMSPDSPCDNRPLALWIADLGMHYPVQGESGFKANGSFGTHAWLSESSSAR